MAWDFQTEPEFQEQLAWMEEFVRAEIWPLETLMHELEWDALMRAMEPLQEQVRERGLWAAHLDPELGGQGFGQVKLGLMHEILGATPLRAVRRSATTRPTRATPSCWRIGGTTNRRSAGCSPCWTATCSRAFSMTEPERRRRPHDARRRGEARRRRVGDQRPQVVHVQRLDRRLPHRDGRHRPRRSPVPGALDDRRPDDRHAGRRHRARHPDDGAPDSETFGRYGGHAEILYRDVRVPADDSLGAKVDGFVLAQQRLGPGRIHHAMRWIGQSQRAFDMLCERAVSRVVYGEPLAEKQTIQNWIADSARRDPGARLMTLHAAWKMDTAGRRAQRASEIAMIKFWGGKVLHDVDRPRHPGPRVARLLHRPAARGDVPLARARDSTTAPTRSTASPSPARSSRATSRARCRPSTCPRAARRPASASRICSTLSRRTTEPGRNPQDAPRGVARVSAPWSIYHALRGKVTAAPKSRRGAR